MEGAHQVFAHRQVHAGFAAHAGVHLGEQRGGHLEEGHAPQEGGRGKAAHVPGDAAPQGDDEVRAGEALPGQGAVHLQHRGQLLGGLPAGNTKVETAKPAFSKEAFTRSP